MSLHDLVNSGASCAPDAGAAASSSTANPLSQFADTLFGSSNSNANPNVRNKYTRDAIQHNRFNQPQQHGMHAVPGMPMHPPQMQLSPEEFALMHGNPMQMQMQMPMGMNPQEHQMWMNEFMMHEDHMRRMAHGMHPGPGHAPPPSGLHPMHPMHPMHGMPMGAMGPASLGSHSFPIDPMMQMQMQNQKGNQLADEFMQMQMPPNMPRSIPLHHNPMLTDMEHAFAAASKAHQNTPSMLSQANTAANAALAAASSVANMQAAADSKTQIHAQQELAELQAIARQRARQHFQDAPEEFIEEQVNEFMQQISASATSASIVTPGVAQAQAQQQREQQEQNWASQFGQLHLHDDAATAGTTTTAPKTWAEEFAAPQAQQDWAAEFEAADRTSWAEEFTSLEGDFQDNFDEELKAYLGKDPNETEYEFAQNNPYLGDPQAMEVGEKFLSEGELSQAVLAFEAVVQADPTNSKAWFLLGSTQNECDEDVKAIAALRRCVETYSKPMQSTGASESAETATVSGPANEFVLRALLALSVSYTNELDYSRALDFMRKWMDAHPLYHGEVSPSLMGDTSSMSAHEVLLKRLTDKRDRYPMDPDIHQALGVMYNLSREYDLAAQAFQVALRARPDEYHLWNKLGASCANGGDSREALKAYRRAVQLKPQYVRAWVNVGTSYSNEGQYDQAMRYYVKALRMNPDMKHVWGYLRTNVIALGREDLLELIQLRNLDELARMFP